VEAEMSQELELPTEIWFKILVLLDGVDLRICSALNSKMYRLTSEPTLWKETCFRNSFSPLIQDISLDRLEKDTKQINWKRVFLLNYRRRERAIFLDLLIKRTSDETLFGGLQVFHSLSSVTPSLSDGIYGDGCLQCMRDSDSANPNSLEHLRTLFAKAAANGILWEQGTSGNSLDSQERVNFLQHTLKMGCSWGASTKKIPKRFILEFDS
jgi:F-box-like